MADFTALKSAIQTYIKQNGNEEITGEKLQEILLSVVTTLGDSAINDLVTALNDEVAARQNADGTLQQNITNEATARGNADTALGGRIDDEATARANGDTVLSNRLGSTITAENTAADQIGAEAETRAAADTALQELIDGITSNIENGYVYAGIATPSSTPATGKVFYLALTAGTYTNFGSTEVSQGINILKFNGSAWSLDAFIGIDDTPTPKSPKLVKSGGAFDSVMTNGSAFDISAHFASGGTLATYADLSAALAALNSLSASYKRGGMSIKFIQSSDNKYVQYFLTKDEWSASEGDWEKINLEEEIDGTVLYNQNKTIAQGEYRVIIRSFPTVSSQKKAKIKITGIDGTIAFRTSEWIGGTDINFEDGKVIYAYIPSECPNVVVNNKDSAVVESATNISIYIAYEGIDERVGFNEKDIENLKTIPFIDVSSRFPTGGIGGTNVYTQTTARQAVPADERRKGLVIQYITENGVVIEQYPLDYALNDWVYGGWNRINGSQVINLNYINNNSSAYASDDAAKDAVPVYYRTKGIVIVFKSTIGWKIMMLNNDSWTKVVDKWLTLLTDADYLSIKNKQKEIKHQLAVYLLDDLELVNGYRATPTSAITPFAYRVTLQDFITVKKGDVIELLDYDYLFYIAVYNEDLTTELQTRNYNFSKVEIKQDGLLNIVIENKTDPNQSISVSDVSNKIRIIKYGTFNSPNIEFCSYTDFIKGYIDADGNIHPHNSRIVNWRGLIVHKGDLIYPIKKDFSIRIVEYSNAGVKVGESSVYYRSTPSGSGINDYCGTYVAQNDGYVMCQCVDESPTPDYDDLKQFDKSICVIHINTSSLLKLANGVIKAVPTAPKKGVDITVPNNYGKEMQAGTIIGDNIWMQTDNYLGQSDSKKIIVFNKNTGALVNTIITDLHGSMSYDVGTDILLASISGKALLFFSPDVSTSSLSSADANVVIDFEDEETTVYCWGEDYRTIYAVNSYDGSTPSTQRRWAIEKRILGTTDGNYDGTFEVDKIYTGIINEGVDTFYATSQGNANYIQDLDYDGYLYVAVGNKRHNFLVIDLDDHASTFTVVGNYIQRYYDSDRVEHNVEPELIALDGAYIYCGVRNWDDNIYRLSKYVR